MNKKILAGLSLSIFFIVVALFGVWIAPYDINDYQGTQYIDGKIYSAPYPPSLKHPLGTDRFGYDILTKLLYGARYTIFLALVISFFRIFFGLIIGIFLGIKKKNKKKSLVSIAWGVIPAFVVVYFFISPFNIQLEKKEVSYTALIYTIIIFTLVGIPGIVSNIRERTEIIMSKEFISAARILGSNFLRMMWKHIFPHLKETVITLFVTEIVLVLTLFGQLGIFDIFIGGTLKYLYPVEYHSITNEWAGLIGQMRGNIYSKQWIILAPMSAYLLLIISFQLLSSGLNEYYKKKLHNYPYI